MRRKFKRALKNLDKAYDFPNPTRENSFFPKLRKRNEKKPLLMLLSEHRMRVCRMAAVCAVMIVMVGGYSVYQNYRNGSGSIPIVDLEESTDESTLTTVQTDNAGASLMLSSEKVTQSVSSETTAKTSAVVTSGIFAASQRAAEGDTTARQDSQQKATTAVVKETQIDQTTKKENVHTVLSAVTAKQTTKTMTAAKTTIQTVVHSTVSATVTSQNSNGFFPNENHEDEKKADYRVTPAYQYEKTGSILELKEFPVSPPTDDANGTTNTVKPFSWQSSADMSDLIVSGTVISLTYTRIEDELWTQVDIEITKVYSGTLQSGDKISIYERGGYMPAAEYLKLHPGTAWEFLMTEAEIQNTTCFDAGEQETTSILGENCLYFLRKSTGEIPPGAYTYVMNADNSRYQWSGSSFENVLHFYNDFAEEELIAYLQRKK